MNNEDKEKQDPSMIKRIPEQRKRAHPFIPDFLNGGMFELVQVTDTECEECVQESTSPDDTFWYFNLPDGLRFRGDCNAICIEHICPEMRKIVAACAEVEWMKESLKYNLVAPEAIVCRLQANDWRKWGEE